MITEEDSTVSNHPCYGLDPLSKDSHIEFENYASNSSDIMKQHYQRDLSSDNLLSLGNLDRSDDQLILQKKQNDILWHEISTFSNTIVDVSDIKMS